MILRWPRTKSNYLIHPGIRPVYGAVICGIGLITLTVLLTDFRFDAPAMTGALLSLTGIAMLGNYLDRCGIALGAGIEGIALFGGICVIAPLCAVILASTNLPLADPLLARLDQDLFFGFNRSDFAQAVAARPGLMRVVQMVYHSLIVQPSILIAILFGTGRQTRGRTLLLAWALALGITLMVFPFFPATGSPPYFLDFQGTFNGARDGTLKVLGPPALTGIITFPSFHAAAAVLLGWGFAPIKRIGPPLVALNAAMFVSALVAGHYLIDLVAGALVASISIVLAGRIQAGVEPGSVRAPTEPKQAPASLPVAT